MITKRELKAIIINHYKNSVFILYTISSYFCLSFLNMSADKFEITIFGGTGLTGKQIIRHVYELSIDHPEFYDVHFSWAIAGRNLEHLEQIVQEMSNRYPKATINKPHVLIANVTQREQLDAMTGQTKVLINAVGPFRFMGEYVVRSCVEMRCDYVDVTGKLDLDGIPLSDNSYIL